MPSPSWWHRFTCSHAREKTYQANWSLASPRRKYKPPPWFADRWLSNVVQWLGCKWQVSRYDRWGVQERPGMVLERDKNGIGTGPRTGFKRYKKWNLTKFENLERGRTTPRPLSTSFQLFVAVPPLFSPVFHDFGQKRDKRVPKFWGTGKERKAFFPVSFPFPFFYHSFPGTSLAVCNTVCAMLSLPL